jgi:C4-type Zn-finger protein
VHEEKHAAFDFRIECPVCHRIIMWSCRLESCVSE